MFTARVFWQVVLTPLAQRDSTAICQAVTQLEKSLLIAEQQLKKHAFLVGDHLTLADIQFGHILFRYYDIDIERAPLPALASYYARLCERPAFLEHVCVSYDDLRA